MLKSTLSNALFTGKNINVLGTCDNKVYHGRVTAIRLEDGNPKCCNLIVTVLTSVGNFDVFVRTID